MYSKGYGGGWGGKGGPRQESKGSHITDITDLKSQSNPVVNNHTSVISWLGKGWWISIKGLGFYELGVIKLIERFC